MMKKTFLYVLAVLATALCFTSCQQEEPTFDESLLIGKWQQTGTEIFYIYASNHTGKTWNEAAGGTESNAQPFTWSLDHNSYQIHLTEMDSNEPKTYTVTQLTSNKLTYVDDSGKEFSFNKVKEPFFDAALLIGKWQQTGTEIFYTYASDYTGKTWDEADDVTEAEANTFRWTLDHATLTQIHIIPVVGGEAPEVYTVTQLTSSKLTYEDDFGHEFSFNKVN